MDFSSENRPVAPRVRAMDPAPPLWRLAPTRGDDGRCLADFMMLIPGLGGRPERARALVAGRVREVCESYGGQVAFADINYSLNVLWVSVAAEPGLAGRVAQSIRGRVPEALLVGGQLGAVPATPALLGRSALWTRLRRLSRRITARIEGPRRDQT
jgi:hypothetical protein